MVKLHIIYFACWLRDGPYPLSELKWIERQVDYSSMFEDVFWSFWMEVGSWNNGQVTKKIWRCSFIIVQLLSIEICSYMWISRGQARIQVWGCDNSPSLHIIRQRISEKQEKHDPKGRRKIQEWVKNSQVWKNGT